MSTEPHRPTSRITDALLPQTAPTPAPATAPRQAPQPPPRQASQQQPTGPATERPPAEPPAHPPAGRPAAAPPPQSPTRRAPQGQAAGNRAAAQPLPPVHHTTEQAQARPPARPVAAPPPAPAPASAAPASQPRQAPEPALPQPPAGPGPGAALPAVETTTRLRPIRDAHPRPAHAPAYGVDRWALPDELPVETTTRLRPVQDRRPGRVLAAAGFAVLGLGLVGGSLTGALLAGSGAGEPAEPPGYSRTKALWHDAPVDTLFPRTLAGPTAGPGGAARTWTRIVVAPDAPCTAAVLPKGLLTGLRDPGCERVLRATYTDATSSHVTTVALVFTQADPATMRTLGPRADDDPPPALAGPATVAAGFGDRQRASWWRHILPDLPVVVTSVSGFADGRPVAEAEPAERAMTAKRTTPVAQAGLGHEAKGVGDAVERALRKTVAATLKEGDR
ncbi:hypothetical protein ACFU3J_06465 [Streptomyces sp. NPDC057411]|uniref:hypothetical protein n=1 Tax=unclassified Streptomyces TaxID=2593676 RepID=UPI00363A61EA